MTSECKQAREAMALGLNGEPGEAGLNWREHAATCAACAAEAAVYRQLATALTTSRERAAARPDLDAGRMRAELMVHLRGRRPTGTHPFWFRPLTGVSFAAAMVALGFGGGWLAHGRSSAPPAAAAVVAVSEPLAVDTALYRVDAVGNSDSGVAIRYATLRQEELDAPVSDPRVQELLAAAVEHPGKADVRVQALDWLSRVAQLQAAPTTSPMVEAAMLDALRTDPSPEVRLRALQALAPLARRGVPAEDGSLPPVLAELAAAGLQDRSADVRSQAIATLSQAPTASAVPLLQNVGEMSTDPAVRMRCAAALEQLRAPVPQGLLATVVD